MTTPLNLPDGTYGVECEFHTGSKRYTYFVDQSQGEINSGDHVVVASPGGGFKVIYVCGRVRDLTDLKVPLQYMKYVVMKVYQPLYDQLMKNLIAVSEGSSTIIDEGDAGRASPKAIPKAVGEQAGDDIYGSDSLDPTDGDPERGQNVPGNSLI